jgi:DNA repair protein RadC
LLRSPWAIPRAHLAGASEDADRIARSIYGTLDADKEHFLLLTLNNKNRVNGFKVVSTGSLTASLVHPREVWRAALHLCAAAVVFVHNHPSGDPAPSQEDQEITRRLKETGEMLGIRVLDHVVLGDSERFFSFSARAYCSRLTFALHCEGLGKLAA